jgi:cysteine-rich repeat protein
MRTSTISHSLAASFAILLALNGCKDDTAVADGETNGTGSEDTGVNTIGDGDGDPGDGDGDATTGDGDGDGDTTGDGDGDPTGGGECGNGTVEPGEGCDDGNLESGDGCSSACGVEGPIECGGQIYACGDEVDNDQDGKIDLQDPECISPCDDDETTFKTNLPGQNQDCKSDCYFDSNSGGGDDKCQWDLSCDPENPGAEIGCEYDPNNNMCETQMPPECLDFCVPLLPNGCDCFGCCEIDGQFVYLDGAECALDNIDSCQSCTFFENCNNPCEPELCELCFGQDPDDLPPECDEPGCGEGLDPCLLPEDCPESFYCQTGCCVPINIP